MDADPTRVTRRQMIKGGAATLAGALGVSTVDITTPVAASAQESFAGLGPHG